MIPPAALLLPWRQRLGPALGLVGFAVAVAASAVAPIGTAEGEPPTERFPATATAASLTQQARNLEAVDPLRGIAPAEEAIRRARSPSEKLAAEAVLANLLRQRTDYQAALKLAQAGLTEATALGDARLRGGFLCDLGRIEWNLADNVAALKHYYEAIMIAEQLNDSRLLVDAHLGAFIVWFEFSEEGLAREELAAAGRYALPLGDPMRLADYYRELGNEREIAHDAAAARSAHERSREISARAGQTRGVADAELNLSGLDEAEGRLDESRVLAASAIAAYERLGLKRYLANAERQLGRVLLKQGRFAEAIACQNRSLALALAFGGRAAIANSYRELAAANEAAGNLAAALDYRHKLEVATSAIVNERSRQQIALVQARFEAERSRRQVELLQTERQAKEAELRAVRQQRYWLITVTALGLAAAAAMVSRARLKLFSERRILTETLVAQQAAEQANELKSRLLAIASHDLKSPLGAIIGGAQLIQDNLADPRLAAELAGDVRSEGKRLLALVSDLLDVAKIEQGRLQLVSAPCDLALIGAERVRAHQRAAIAKGQKLTWALAPAGTAAVAGDPGRLAQVFDNLLENAVKFTPSGGNIHLTVTTEGSRATASICDEGPGFAPAEFHRLFEPFQTLSAKPTAGESSSGLGLFIVREIVSLHGGRIGIDSAPGQGATIMVELPLAGVAAAQTI